MVAGPIPAGRTNYCMNRIKNYIGQLRLYSLADLILLLVAIRADRLEFIGAIILHIAFLAYLENKHSHPYRARVPRWISYILAIIGVLVYGKIEGIIYLLFGFLYVKKTRKLGFVSPALRGLQNLFIVAGVIGYHSVVTYIVGGLFLIRNLAGDFRDMAKDKKEGMRTFPVIIGVNNNFKYIHIILMIFTSAVWWYLSSTSISWLILIIIIEISTYNLTPR